MARTGVLLQGYGGPKTVADVGPFMTNLMGREPSPELLARVSSHYEAIGGGSPLLGIAEEIAAKLERLLSDDGHNVPVRVGMRYWEPYLADTVAELVDAGRTRIVTLSLSAFESEIATGAYRKVIASLVETHPGVEFVEAPLAAVHEAYDEFYTQSVTEALARMGDPAGAVVAFSAHSLPLADVSENDPYVAGIEETAREVARMLGLGQALPDAGERFSAGLRTLGSDEDPHPWYLVYQSKGARPGGWLGPELDELLDAVSAAGAPGIVVCPIGFMTDHMETLWDLDIVAAKKAEAEGLAFERASVPNADESVLRALASSVEELL